jgi:hypothetical protein
MMVVDGGGGLERKMKKEKVSDPLLKCQQTI